MARDTVEQVLKRARASPCRRVLSNNGSGYSDVRSGRVVMAGGLYAWPAARRGGAWSRSVATSSIRSRAALIASGSGWLRIADAMASRVAEGPLHLPEPNHHATTRGR